MNAIKQNLNPIAARNAQLAKRQGQLIAAGLDWMDPDRVKNREACLRLKAEAEAQRAQRSTR